ncbi:MAG TPA: dipicolinic acid synthetase, partial [Ruminococcaceae bacterium]|nr:dipicolinic acid synthetase [Oscillospiraceae bacterium]
MAAACNLTFCVVGRDARQLAAAQALQNSGYTVLGAEGAGQADYILLPMPMDAEAADLARILRAARPGTLALGGRISEPVRKAAQAAGVELVDYFLRPELACLNAVPTAEGCLALLMQLRQRTIWESEFLVLGYGRIGRAVARRLQALGGQVTIAA